MYADMSYYRLKLTPGVIDENAIAAYTEGQCVALAYAIHLRTGWPMVAAEHDNEGCSHGAVEMPDGRILDIEGAHDREAFHSAWGDFVRVSPKLVRRWGRKGDMQVKTRHADHFAGVVLSQYV